MELSPGTALLHYRLVAPIGEGGMGAVWRAADTKLGREVALKVLPEDFASDPERMARFEREARVLASLNHPNIAHLYGLESSPVIPSEASSAARRRVEGPVRLASLAQDEPGRGSGVVDASPHPDPSTRGADEPLAQDDRRVVTFLVMELVEGEELSERIEHGPLPVEAALPIALQIAEGLEAAHERGVVHRDLKPANLMIARGGTVKILDFGLATAWQPGGGDADLTRSPTVTAQMTQAGVILGTAAYMSPEQARGLPLDRRTDLWAFGVVLYEMLSGASCFGGETVTDILASIVKEPPDWSKIPEPLPWRVRELLERMLVKDPYRRLRDIGEARLVLEAAIAGADEAAPGARETPPEARTTRRPSWLWLAAGLVVGALATIALLGSRGESTASSAAPVTHLQVTLPEGQKLAYGRRVSNTIGVSPDGRTIAVATADLEEVVDYYAESSVDTRLWMKSLDTGVGSFVAGSEGAMAPFFSPDGRWVAFFARGKLRKVLVAGGGAVEAVCDASDPWGGSWPSKEEMVFASSRAGGVVTQRVDAAGGPPEVVAELETSTGEQEQNFPSLVGGGGSLLYMAWRAGETSFARILLLDLESGRRTPLVEGGLRPEFHPPYLLYNVGPKLYGVRMTVDPPGVEGGAVEIADDVLVDNDYDAGQWAASSAGTLAYAGGGRPPNARQLVWVDDRGAVDPIVAVDKSITHARVAADGRVLYAAIDVNTDIYSHDLKRGTTSRITVDPSWDGDPVPSTRGDRLAFGSYRGGSEELFILESDGTIVKPLSANVSSWPESWSRDDSWLAYCQRSPTSGTDIWLLPTAGQAAEPVPLAATSAAEEGAVFSPAADYIAYVSDVSGAEEVWMQTYPTEPGRGAILVTNGGGTDPVWSGDGSRLYYRSGQGLMAIDVAYEPSLRLGQPTAVLDDPTLRVHDAADDGRLLAVQSEPLPDITTLNVILGFDRLLQAAR